MTGGWFVSLLIGFGLMFLFSVFFTTLAMVVEVHAATKQYKWSLKTQQEYDSLRLRMEAKQNEYAKSKLIADRDQVTFDGAKRELFALQQKGASRVNDAKREPMDPAVSEVLSLCGLPVEEGMFYDSPSSEQIHTAWKIIFATQEAA